MNLNEEQHNLVADALYEMARQIVQVAESCAKAADTDVMPVRQDAWRQGAEEAEAQADRIRDLADLVADAEAVTLRPHAEHTGDITDDEDDDEEEEADDEDDEDGPQVVETDFAVAPGEYLAEYLGDHGLSLQEFLDATALDADLVDGVMQARTPITDEIAERLAGATAIPAHSWMRLESTYRCDLGRLAGADHDCWSEQDEQ